MRILVVGAGGVGGYFGGRLAAAGRDVTFLVRERRAELLADQGLRVRSPFGDIDLAAPQTVTRETLATPFELVVIGCKAYDLPGVINDVVPAVGPETAILPLLNGMRHLDELDARFGASRVLGGQCHIAATLDGEGVVHHLNRTHSLTFGERDGSVSPRMRHITAMLSDAGFDARPSQRIVQDMWDKWVFLATLAGITCLMRASVGDIMAAPAGHEITLELLDNCVAVASEAGHAPDEPAIERTKRSLTESGSTLTASMLRDIQRGGPIEADHIVGDMIARAGRHRDGIPLLRVAYAHLKAYEASRVRAS
ncbi:2-dehydropantoate 2-reductase [Aerolutibacter ruishenii]|nr:2-dehydropantoate 2-reductase [Lysobacter ruishenii]